MPRGHAQARLRLVAVLVAATTVPVTAACGQAPAAPVTPAFCQRAGELMELDDDIEDEDEYPQLVTAYEATIAVAPAELVPDLTALRDYYRNGGTGDGDAVWDASVRLTQTWRSGCP
ncbi:hypothetical protein ACQEVB_34140 [Pseudonocardia sp. CA-107938]|uniref:hypothetical protein n=1 Tax=Pseudonocardia sp. CA-107938 TaxID=3240021 RepID=UPI003D92F4A5